MFDTNGSKIFFRCVDGREIETECAPPFSQGLSNTFLDFI